MIVFNLGVDRKNNSFLGISIELKKYSNVEKLPKNALNKVLKRKLREEAIAKMKEQMAAASASAEKPSAPEAE